LKFPDPFAQISHEQAALDGKGTTPEQGRRIVAAKREMAERQLGRRLRRGEEHRLALGRDGRRIGYALARSLGHERRSGDNARTTGSRRTTGSGSTSSGEDDPPTEYLVARAQVGDERAFEQLVARYWSKAWNPEDCVVVQRGEVCKIASRFPPRGCDRDDLIQGGLIGLAEAVRGYDRERGDFKVYAKRCIKHRIVDELKKATRAKHGPLNDAESLNLTVALDDREEVDRVECELRSITYHENADPVDKLSDRETLTSFPAKLSDLEHSALAADLAGERLDRDPKSVGNAIQRAREKAMAEFDGEVPARKTKQTAAEVEMRKAA